MIKLTNILSEIKVNTPSPTSNKVKDLIIKLVQNVDQSNMREIYNVLDKYGYGDLIFDDAELYNPDFIRIKNLQDLYNDLKSLQSKLNINEIKINKPDTIKSAEWDEAHRNLIYSFDIELSDIHGEGLFTNEPISKNRIFLTAGHPKDVYYNASYINHSSNPNSILVQSKDPLDGEIFYFVQAKRDIRPNEEITINYRTLPSNFDRNTTGFVNEIKVNQPIITPNTQLTQKIKDYIIDIIKSNTSENINEHIIDGYMSDYMSSNSTDVEDTIIDYVKHKMLSDEDIDMDSEEINSLDRDAIIEYINNNKSLQSYLCNIFWKYYIKYVNSILPKLIEDCLDNLKADSWGTPTDYDIEKAVGKVIDENDDYIIIDYPTEIIGRDDKFYQYLYNELIKDNSLNEIKVNQPQGKMFKLIKTHVPDQDRYVYDLAFIRPKPRNDINYLDNLLSQHYSIGASGYLLPNGDFELYFISKNYFNSLGINTYEKIGTITPHPVTVIPAKYINQSELAEIKINQPEKPRTLVGPYGEKTTNVSKFIKNMESHGHPLIKIFTADDEEVQSANPIYDFSWLIGLPEFKGLNGPMKDLNSIRYETWNQRSIWEIKVNQPAVNRHYIPKHIKHWINTDWDDLRYELGEDEADALWLLRFILNTNDKDIKDTNYITTSDVKKYKEIHDDVWDGDAKSLIEFLYEYGVLEDKPLNEITINTPQPPSIGKFLNKHKKEVWEKLISNMIDEEAAEEYNLPENLSFNENTTPTHILSYELGLDLSFNEADVTEEDNPYIDTDEIKIAGKTVYYCSYSI